MNYDKKDIIDAWGEIRKIDQTIPDEVLDLMKDAAIEKLEALPHDMSGSMPKPLDI